MATVILLLSLACAPLSNEDLRPPLEARDQDGDGITPEDGDCDDTDDGVAPGLSEAPYNGLDDDCDPGTPDDDLDGDGYLAAEDCDDADEDRNPGEVEECRDDTDADCDGFADDEDPDCTSPSDGWIDLILLPNALNYDASICWGGPEGLDCVATYAVNSTYFGVGDVDGDGRPEILVGEHDAAPAELCWIEANALDCEEIGPTRDGYVSSNGAPAVGDLDEDGLPDVVLPGSPVIAGPAQACLQGADGEFTCSDIPTSTSADTVDLLDLDDDGDTDVVFTAFRDTTYYCLNEGGAFPACVEWEWAEGGRRLLADVDGDGDEELLSTTKNGGVVRVCQGEGLGRLDQCADTSAYPCMGPWVGDLDGAYGIDLVCTGDSVAQPLVCLSDGAGDFGCTDALVDSAGIYQSAVVVDLDGDGADELLLGHGGRMASCVSVGGLQWGGCVDFAEDTSPWSNWTAHPYDLGAR